MILIGGATGHLGKAVVARLLAQGAKVRFAVLSRDAAKAKPYADQGVEVRIADFDVPGGWPPPLPGLIAFSSFPPCRRIVVRSRSGRKLCRYRRHAVPADRQGTGLSGHSRRQPA